MNVIDRKGSGLLFAVLVLLKVGVAVEGLALEQFGGCFLLAEGIHLVLKGPPLLIQLGLLLLVQPLELLKLALQLKIQKKTPHTISRSISSKDQQ